MKRINVLITAILVLLIFGCTSTANNNSKNQKNLTQSDNIMPEHLGFESFKEMVWDFETTPNEWTYKGDMPCIIDFYADWCSPCKKIAPIMEELASEYEGKIKIYKIDTDVERKLASVFEITGIPAILFVPLNGQPMKQTGAMSKEYYEKIINENLLISTE
ncbi:MAG: redoxin domain-containing protein [Bacteroidetes bacterium]|nr:redoxin domain-containing protein [Bacteroidota bacterium]